MKLCPTGCGRNAKRGHLMCGLCWSLVPRPLQVEVLRTWENYRRAYGKSASMTAIKVLLADYRKAADAAIAAVR